MPVPGFQNMLKPLLALASDGAEHSMQEARKKIAEEMKLTTDDLAERLPSGMQTTFNNRVAWAKSHLVQAMALTTTKKGFFLITERGKELYAKGLEKIDLNTLKQYREFVDFITGKKNQAKLQTEATSPMASTPEETLQQAYDSLRNHLASELLSRVKENTPEFFENLVVDLMVAMGYGGSRSDAGKSIGQRGDEGVDGIIKEDRLGLDVIYLQAKRWEGTVGRPEIQKFVGALAGKRAKKGVFLTTGKFSDDALAYAEKIEQRVILIDGLALAEFMIDFNIGTSTTAIFPVKRIDSDYFAEE